MTRQEICIFWVNWCRNRLPFLVAYFFFIGLMIGFRGLFEIEEAVVFYALVLLTVIWCLVLLWDIRAAFVGYRAILHGQEVSGGTAGEQYLQERVGKLEDEVKQLQEQQVQVQTELDDYYTLWAHQMKTPIAASQLLVKEIDQPAVRHQLEAELFKVEQYAGLVLNYLRLQSFHDDLVIQQVDLEQLVKSVVKKYSLFFIQSKTSLELEKLSRTITTDQRWLSLLMEQLLSNALKYCQNGMISIFMDGDDLVIRDTGIGIAESDLNRVFERGFSGFNGRRTQQSSGLGLYLSKKIAAELGYSLRLSSKVGQGTEVRIGLAEVELALD